MPTTIEPPADLQDFLQSFVVAILRNKPEDLLEFAAGYFNDKLEERNAEEAAANGSGNLPGLGNVQFRPGQNADSESEQESDEGMCEEEEARMMQRMAMSRRKSVSAEGYDPDADDDDDDDQHIVHGKSDEQRKRLISVVEPMLLFKNIDSEQFNQVIDRVAKSFAAFFGLTTLFYGNPVDFFEGGSF